MAEQLVRNRQRVSGIGNWLFDITLDETSTGGPCSAIESYQTCKSISSSYSKVIVCVMEYGTDVNGVTDTRGTPLHVAVTENVVVKGGVPIEEQRQRPLVTLQSKSQLSLTLSRLESISSKCVPAKAVCASQTSYSNNSFPREPK